MASACPDGEIFSTVKLNKTLILGNEASSYSKYGDFTQQDSDTALCLTTAGLEVKTTATWRQGRVLYDLPAGDEYSFNATFDPKEASFYGQGSSGLILKASGDASDNVYYTVFPTSTPWGYVLKINKATGKDANGFPVEVTAGDIGLPDINLEKPIKINTSVSKDGGNGYKITAVGIYTKTTGDEATVTASAPIESSYFTKNNVGFFSTNMQSLRISDVSLNGNIILEGRKTIIPPESQVVNFTGDDNNIGLTAFENVMGHDLTATFINETDGITWTFKGTDITTPQNMDFNILNVSLNDSNITKLLSSSAKIKTLNFMHNGNLPGKAELKIKVKEVFGDSSRLYLYQYDTNTKELVSINDNIEVVDGVVTMSLTSCSEMFLTDMKALSKQDEVVSDTTSKDEIDKSSKAGDSDVIGNNPKTGDMMTLYCVMILLSLLSAFCFMKLRKSPNSK